MSNDDDDDDDDVCDDDDDDDVCIPRMQGLQGEGAVGVDQGLPEGVVPNHDTHDTQ